MQAILSLSTKPFPTGFDKLEPECYFKRHSEQMFELNITKKKQVQIYSRYDVMRVGKLMYIKILKRKGV